jgi:DinB superfamily
MAPSVKVLWTVLFLAVFHATVFAQTKSRKYDEATNLIHWPAAFNPKKANFYVYNEIAINASPETVWKILIDAKKWHTFYKGAEKPVVIDHATHQTLALDVSFRFKTMGINFQPTIKEFIPNERMAWEINTHKLKAYHAWIIVPTQTGCKLITPEAQNGFLTFLQKVFQPNKLLNLHEHWLAVIKTRAEGTTPMLTPSEVRNIKKVLHHSLTQLNDVVHDVSDAQLNFKPAPDKWSIAECIEHITLAELEFPEILEAALQKPANAALRRKIKIKDDEIQPRMTSRKWTAKSPEIFKPSNTFSTTQEAIIIFQKQRNQTIGYIENTKDDLRNHYWHHPLTGKIDLYQTLLLMSAHLERHIDQIKNIKKSNGFPLN